MDRSGDKGMSKTIHGKERGCGRCVAEIIDKGSLCHSRAGSRLCWNDRDIGAVDFVQDKRESNTGKVTSPTHASGHDIHFLLTKFLKLFFGLEPNDRLMHHHMIENASKRISGVLGGDGILNGFADGDPKASGRIWVLLENLSSCIGIFAWAGDTVCSPGVHHETTIRFLIITDPHHIDLTLKST